ncbi:MAG: hypothetical protein K5697_17165 [Lachnospiraceae bacterium]|nr:hypothetical protein [Lachnospiraceae bacterium]
MTKKRRLVLIAIPAAAAVIVAAVCIFHAAAYPSGVTWRSFSQELSGGRRLVLSKKALRLVSGEESYWQTDEAWLIEDVLVTDINRDGADELLLLLWKRGRYGKHKPSWVEEAEDEWSQHIFIYSLPEGTETPKQLWCASDIGRLVKHWEPAEGRPWLLILDDDKGERTWWIWDSWGLKSVEQK